jgi:hypothetical protein
MNLYLIYGFIIGLFVGRFTNLISNLIISGIVLYFCKPEFYTYENLFYIKNITQNIVQSFLE